MTYSITYEQDLLKSIGDMDFSDLHGKSLFLTGATGLIGSAMVDIIQFLNAKKNLNIMLYLGVRNIEKAKIRYQAFPNLKNIELIQYDACKQLNMDIDTDYIIHAASNADPQSYGSEPVETMLANFTGLHQLLQYAYVHNVQRVLYVSSSEVYGKNSDNTLYQEGHYGYVDILNPRACYPSSKRAAETLCAAYEAEYGVDTVIVRPGHIYGPTQTAEDSRASAQFLNNVVKGNAIIMKSDGQQLRSYCHCLDCATSILTVLLRGHKGEAYNISNANSVVTIRKFAEVCARTAGVKILYENPSEAELSTYNMMECSALDSCKIENLGWKAAWGIEEGIEESIRVLKGI